MASTTFTTRGRSLAAALLAVMVISVAGCSDASGPTPSTVAYVHTSYARSHSTLAQARSDSDLVIVGTVAELVGSEEDQEVPGLPVSTYRIRVERSLAGNVAGDVFLHARGGVLNGVSYVLADEDPLVIGERDAFFLTRIVGGPYAGQYYLSNPDCRISVRSDGRLATRAGLQLDPKVTDVASLESAIRK
jgi:hypothetical protein